MLYKLSPIQKHKENKFDPVMKMVKINPGSSFGTSSGSNFDVNRNILSLRSFVASFKKNLFEV